MPPRRMTDPSRTGRTPAPDIKYPDLPPGKDAGKPAAPEAKPANRKKDQ